MITEKNHYSKYSSDSKMNHENEKVNVKTHCTDRRNSRTIPGRSIGYLGMLLFAGFLVLGFLSTSVYSQNAELPGDGFSSPGQSQYNFISGFTQWLGGAVNHLVSGVSVAKNTWTNSQAACSSHGVLVSDEKTTTKCICDLGWSGANCNSQAAVSNGKPTANGKILLVTSSFGKLYPPSAASFYSAFRLQSMDHIAKQYERLVTELNSSYKSNDISNVGLKGADVLLVVPVSSDQMLGNVGKKWMHSFDEEYKNFKDNFNVEITLLTVEVPGINGKLSRKNCFQSIASPVSCLFDHNLSVDERLSLATFNYLRRREKMEMDNLYSVIQSPVSTPLLHHYLQARKQGIIGNEGFDSRIISHMDSVSQETEMLALNGDDVSSLGKLSEAVELDISNAAGKISFEARSGNDVSTKEFFNVLKSDFMSRKSLELSDIIVIVKSSDQNSSDKVSSSIGSEIFQSWTHNFDLSLDNVISVPELPYVYPYDANEESKWSNELEIVLIGSPGLDEASCIKNFAAALDDLKAKILKDKSNDMTEFVKSNVHVTFLGLNAPFRSANLDTSEFLDLRAFNWPVASWKVESMFSISDMIGYLKQKSDKMVVAFVANRFGADFTLHSLISNEVPLVAFDLESSDSLKLLVESEDRANIHHGIFSISGELFRVTEQFYKIIAENTNDEHKLKLFERNFQSILDGSITTEPVIEWTRDIYAPIISSRDIKITKDVDGIVVDDNNLEMFPLVSVVIVHHDRVEFLKQAIESIERQTYPHQKIEVILVDDGSSDPDSVQFINDLAWQWWDEKAWKVVREPRRFVGAAKNTGVRYARGDFVLFLDDDDVAKPEKIHQMVVVALKTDSDVITCGYDVFSSSQYPQTSPDSFVSERFIPLGSASGAGIFGNVFGGAGFLVRRSFFVDVGGFSEDFKLAYEEYEFLAKASLMSSAHMEAIPESLTWVRRMNDGSSVHESSDMFESNIRALRPYMDQYSAGSSRDQKLVRLAKNHLFARGGYFETSIYSSSTLVIYFTSTTSTEISTTTSSSTTFTDTITTSVTTTSSPSTTLSILDVQPTLLSKETGSDFLIEASGFDSTVEVVSGDGVTFSSEVVSSSIIRAAITSIDNDIGDSFQFYLQQSSAVDSDDYGIDVYNDNSYIMKVFSQNDIFINSNQTLIYVNISGEVAGDVLTVACWFNYTKSVWNSDRTAKVYERFNASATAQNETAGVISYGYLCVGPELTESTKLDVAISLSGYGYDGITIGSQKFYDVDNLFLDKYPGAETSVTYFAPAPVNLAARLSDNGLYIILNFDFATNGPELDGSNCANLFDTTPEQLPNVTVGYLTGGIPGDCSFEFISPKEVFVRVTISSRSESVSRIAEVGDVLVFKENVLKRRDQRYSKYLSGTSSTIAAPNNPVQPVVNVRYTENFGECSNVIIDLSSSTGSGGKSYTSANFSASIDIVNNTLESSINSQLETFGSQLLNGTSVFSLPSSLFNGIESNVVVSFSFQLGNFLGQLSDVKKFNTTFKTGIYLPEIIIDAPVGNRALRSQRAQFKALVSYNFENTCDGSPSEESVDLSWDLVGPSEQTALYRDFMAGSSGYNLLLPRYWFLLDIEFDVKFTLKFIQGAQSGQEYVVTTPFVFFADDFDASISGGSRSISQDAGNQEFIVDIFDLAWRDSQELQDNIDNYGFSWTCNYVYADGFSQNCGLTLPNEKSVTIDVSSLNVTDNDGSYYLLSADVVYTGIIDRFAPTTSVQLQILSVSVPQVKISYTSIAPAASDPSFYLKASVTESFPNGLIYTWTSEASCGGVDYSEIDLSDADNLRSEPGSALLAFKTNPPVLKSGSSYCIKATVREIGRDLQYSGSSFIVFTTLTRPNGGIFTVDDSTVGVLDTVTFRVSEWVTDPRSGDLFYAFFIKKDDGSRESLGPKSRSGVFTVEFGSPGNRTVVLLVSDENNMFASEVPEITVSVSPKAVDVQQYFTNAVNNFAKEQNAFEVVKKVLTFLDYLASVGNVFRRDGSSGDVDQVLDVIESISENVVLVYNDIGAVLIGVLDRISQKNLDESTITRTMDLLSSIADKVNENAWDVTSCIDSDTSTALISALDYVTQAAEALNSSTSTNRTGILDQREYVLQTFSSCVQRTILCGTKPIDIPSSFGNISYSTIDASVDSDSTYGGGIFKLSDLSTALSTSSGECVSYRYQQTQNFLTGTNSTIGDTVFVLDFRNATINGYGLQPSSNISFTNATSIIISGNFDDNNLNVTLPITNQFDSSLNISGAINNKSVVPYCMFYDRSVGDFTSDNFWSREGCEVLDYSATYVICSCSHLTEYSVGYQSISPNPTPTPGLPGYIVALIVCLSLVFSGFGFVAYKRDSRRRVIAPRKVGVLTDDTVEELAEETAVTKKHDVSRDPTALPSYLQPPSYEQHLSGKKIGPDTGYGTTGSHKERLSNVLKEQIEVDNI